MSAAQHTPGPWHYRERSHEIEALVDAENSQTYYAPVATIDSDWQPGIVQANARLIASAPEYHAMLSDFVNGTISAHALLMRARAAIARAKGVQS